MGDNIVRLDTFEVFTAAIAGAQRQVENLSEGRTPFYGAGVSNDWQLHIEGCLGERALAKFLGIPWTGKGVFRAPDVGDMDVRTTSSTSNRLILHQNDPDDRIFWLVAGLNGNYLIQGWVYGREGKINEFWCDPSGKNRPAFFVPANDLHRPEEFPGYKEAEQCALPSSA